LFPSIEERLTTRKILIVTVGSSASIHLLRGIVQKNPEILKEDEFCIIETSKDMLDIAIETLSSVYQSYYAYERGEEAAKFRGFPTSTFKHKLTEHSILLAKTGGATTPELGLKYFAEKKNFTITKISRIFREENCNGIIILGCAGKGTGTLVTPALIHEILTRTSFDLPHPLGFIALPYRFRRTDVLNAQKTINFIVDNNVPCFLIDYEHAYDIYLYTMGEGVVRPTVSAVYDAVVSGISNTLSSLIEALNYGQYCSPPIDWSDLRPMFRMKGCVGTISCSHHQRADEFEKSWRNDLDRLIFLRNSMKPSRTSIVSIAQSGAGVPLELVEELSKYFSTSWNAERHEVYTLEHGTGFRISNLIYGFDPKRIYPELTYKKYSMFERFKRRFFGR